MNRQRDLFDLFVNSATRRRLKLNPGEAVLLVKKGKDQSWQSLGIADKQYQEVVKRILLSADRWTSEGAALLRDSQRNAAEVRAVLTAR